MRRISRGREVQVLVAFLLAFLAGNALPQSFPAKPLTLLCPCPRAPLIDQHLQAFARIASKYLGQPVVAEFPSDANSVLGLMASARPDGYTVSILPIGALRIPHMRKVPWNPLKDFTYIIGLAGASFGVVVRSDSQIETLKDLIDFAKANPGKFRYGAPSQGDSAHLVMEELADKIGARFVHVPIGTITDSANALADGRVLAISGTTTWAPYVDSGVFRLLVTFGEERSRWNAPTARELGFEILSYSPFGIVAPKGMDPKLTKLLHDAFKRALDDPEHMKLLTLLDLVYWYKSSEDYAEWAVDQFRFQRALIERTIGLRRN